ncbi:leukocyte surface antigen CD47 isoform X4 [Emydura macquarii macquarii]|uniref:leukocyte surface antigen CD47 isoform X4 n=1 Tax=Emydura macquarii macquarii TaxID=1129001 RepID=UPI00352B085E
MRALGAWLLLGAGCAASAQLQFRATKSVEQTVCNETVILPCIVTNLALKNIAVLFVKWKLEKKEFFSFDGFGNKTLISSNFSTAELVSLSHLPLGMASLSISKTQAVPGNYSCEVTESNREGETVIELKYGQASWFTKTENILFIVFLFFAILFYWSQLCFIVLTYETTRQKKICLIIAGVILSVVAAVGCSLVVVDANVLKNQVGLGLIVLPTGILVPLQYFILQIVLESDRSPLAIAVAVLKLVGYLIAVIGFFLCINACPPKCGAVVIAGLAIMTFMVAVGLICVIIRGYNKKSHQLPRMQKE